MSLESMTSALESIRSSVGPKGPTAAQKAAMANLQSGIARWKAAAERRGKVGASSFPSEARRTGRTITFYDKEEIKAMLSRPGLDDGARRWLSAILERNTVITQNDSEILERLRKSGG